MRKALPAAFAILCCLPAIAEDTPARLHFNTNSFSIRALEGPAGNQPAQTLMMFLPPTEGFAPNVNVQIQPYVGTLADYVALSKRQFKTMGLALLNEQSVGRTAVSLEYSGQMQGRKLHWYARVHLHKGKACIATATAAETQWQTVAKQLKACVDSLEVGRPETAGKVICNRTFKLLLPDERGQQAGTYRIKGISRDDGKHIEIIEEITLDRRGQKCEYRSSVVYRTRPTISPVKGTAETRIDGKPCMTGTVQFQADTLSYSWLVSLDKRTGERLDPAKRYEKKDVPKPAGHLLFQSAVPVLGPRVLAKKGELADVVFIEFPDDTDELIHLKGRHRLVREARDEDGRFTMKLFRARSHKPALDIQFDKQDRLLLANSMFGKFKMVETTEEK